MSIELVCGRSKSGKSKYIYDTIAGLCSMGKECILIVPEQFTHVAEKRLLGVIDTLGEQSAEVFSFLHLADSCRRILGCASRGVISPSGKALVIRKILDDNEYEFYSDASQRRGFGDMVAGAISEFKKYNINPDMLMLAASDTDNEILGMKLNDLHIMYREYEDAIRQKYADSDDSLSAFAKTLGENMIYKEKYIFIDGFSTFVPQELEVIFALESQCREMVISLCLDFDENNTSLFMPTRDTYDKIKKLANGKIKVTRLSDTHFNSRDISVLEKSLYTFPSKRADFECTDIEVFSLSNPLAETENCASYIKYLIREKGYMYRDIGVICSDLEMYSRHIDRVFPYCGISYFLDSKNDIMNHHLIRFVLNLIDIYIYDYSYESIFNYLKACFVDADFSRISLLEKFIKKRNIRRSTWLDNNKWQNVLKANYGEDSYVAEIFDKIRTDYILPLARMHEDIKGRKSASYDARVLYEFMLRISLPDIIAGYISKFTDEGEHRLCAQYQKIWQVIMDSLSEIAEFCGDEKVSPAGFKELLASALSQNKVGFIPLTNDGVHIGNTERSRFDGIKVLFVLGVNEGIFPVAAKNDGVLGDADKEAMRLSGIEFSTTSAIAAYYSQFCAYTAFSMPSDLLFVSYSKADNDYKTLRKSYIIERILKIMGINEKSETSINDRLKIHSQCVTRELLCQKMSDYANGQDVEPVWKNVYNYFLDKGTFVSRIKRFSNSDNIASRLSDKNLKLLLPLLSHTSVSKLESYAACRYAYFIDYVMRIEHTKERTVDALDIGNITHMLLENLSKQFGSSREKFESSCDNDILNRIDCLIEEYLKELSYLGDELTARDIYTLKRIKNSVFLCFDTVRKQILNSKFEPLGYEIEFNDSSEHGAIDIITPRGNEITLTGKIDRADICHADGGSYIRVIDYKTGSKEFKLDEVFYGLSVQLMVYLNKLVSLDTSYNYGGALYFSVDDSITNAKPKQNDNDEKYKSSMKLKGIIPYKDEVLDAYNDSLAQSLRSGRAAGKRLEIKDFEVIDNYLKQKIGDVCDEMLKGNFEIKPYKKNGFAPCEYCKYNSVCRFDPMDKSCSYRHYGSISSYSEIIGEMEAVLNVDTKSADGN